MPGDQENFDAANAAVLAKWRREQERREVSAEHIEREAKKTLRGIIEEKENRQNVARDLKKATQSGEKPHTEEGYRGNDELITGFEEKPWDRD